MGEDTPCRGLDEDVEIIAKVDLDDFGASILQPSNHFEEAGFDFRIHKFQELPRREGESDAL